MPEAPLPISPPPEARPAPRRTAALVQIVLVAGVLGVVLLVRVILDLDSTVGDALGVPMIYLHVMLNGAVALGVVAAVLRGFGEGRASLSIRASPVGRTLATGLLAIAPCYLANGLLVMVYVLFTGPDLEQMASEKLDTLDVFSPIRQASILPIAVFVGVYEEVLFRGFLLSRLRTLLGDSGAFARAAAVLLSAAVFGLAHAYQGALGVLQTFGIGVVLAAVAVLTGSIWPCIVAHVGIDVIGLFAVRLLGPMLRETLQATTTPA